MLHSFENSERGLELVSIDIDKDIAAQGPFDMVIYKVTDELVRASTDDIQKRRIENLEVFPPSREQERVQPLAYVSAAISQCFASGDRC